MKSKPPSLSFLAALLFSALSLRGPLAAGPRTERADFSGAWAVVEDAAKDPIDRARDTDPGAKAGGRGEPGSPTGSGSTLNIPWELLRDERVLVLFDDGTTLRVDNGRGEPRVLILDGEEYQRDDGDGPAKVSARRRGSRGERIVASVKWPTGRKRSETWALQAEPRRLVITTDVTDRHPFRFQRTYQPATPAQLAAARKPPATPTPLPGLEPAKSGASTAPVPTAPAVVLSDAPCSIRPPRGTASSELLAMAKISKDEAQRRAEAFAAPRKASSVVTSDVGVQDGCLVYSFVLRFAEQREGWEVAIDAGDGRVLSKETWELK